MLRPANGTKVSGTKVMTHVTNDVDGQAGPTEKAAHETASVRISAVIACYRDAEAIPIMYARLTETFLRIGVDYEIIFVNDGSPDNAASVLADLAVTDPKVVVITIVGPSDPKVRSPAAWHLDRGRRGLARRRPSGSSRADCRVLSEMA